MNEPTRLTNGEAAMLWAEGNDRVRTRLKGNEEWQYLANYGCTIFQGSRAYEFALLPEAPQVVKPAVIGWPSCNERFAATRAELNLPEGNLAVSIVPAEQHAWKIELEDAMVENYCDETACALAAFLRAERSPK